MRWYFWDARHLHKTDKGWYAYDLHFEGVEVNNNSFAVSPGLMRDETGGLANEVYFSNPIVSLKKCLCFKN